jgi:hypothetical protein
MLEWDALLRRLQALIRTQFLPVERFVKGEASSSAGLEAGREESRGLAKIKRPGSWGGGDPGLGGMRVGDPHFSHFTGVSALQ